MKNYELIVELIQLVEQYETENNATASLALSDFTAFLNMRTAQTVVLEEQKFGEKAKKSQAQTLELDATIGRLITYMSRYAKFYSKVVLEKTQLQTIDDFSYLATLLTYESLTKSELITKNIQEKTTGTEVIRRLIAADFVQQISDEKDKRSKRISITAKGRQLLFSIFDDMSIVSTMITGNLTPSEKMNLLFLLKKLDDFHFDIYTTQKIENIGQMADFLKK